MINTLWAFVIVSAVVFSLFFLRPPWTVESVLLGAVPLVMVVVFGYRFWQAKRGRTEAPPEED